MTPQNIALGYVVIGLIVAVMVGVSLSEQQSPRKTFSISLFILLLWPIVLLWGAVELWRQLSKSE